MMKIKRLVTRNISLRFISILCFSVGVFAALNWQIPSKSAPTDFLIHLQPEAKTILQDRNLSDYEFGGRISNCNRYSEDILKCFNTASKARDFIQKHWKEQKRAYIIIDFIGTHGDINNHVFIEPDNKEEWKIVWRDDTFARQRAFNTNISERTARSIKTKRATKENDGESIKLGTSYLVFLDKDGKEIASF